MGDTYTYADIAWFVQYYLMWRTGVVDFECYPNIRRWGAELMSKPSFERGVKQLQPWYAPIAYQVLKFKSRIRRGGPTAKKASTAAN